MVLMALALTGCASAPYTGRSQFIIMNEGEEMSLSNEAYTELLQEEPIERGTQRAKMVDTIGKRIAAVAERPNYQWEFLTIPKDNVLNAMCLPGGKVFVYTGIIKLANNNVNEIAAVMGHEIAHALARHSAESASVNQSVAIGAAMVGVFLGDNSGAVGKLANTLGALGITLPHSRMQESEADHIGLILMAKAGYDPRAAATLWQKMAKANEGKEPISFLSTHPLNADRIKAIEALLPEVMPYYEATKAKK